MWGGGGVSDEGNDDDDMFKFWLFDLLFGDLELYPISMGLNI